MKTTRYPAFLGVLLFLAVGARAAVIDRIAAIVDREVITVSEVQQVVSLRVIPRQATEDDDAYRTRVLEAMIAQNLRFHDVERFGAEDISADAIEARLAAVRKRFASETEFAAAVAKSELSLDEIRTLIKRRLQVEAYIEERFSPLIFVSLDEIERYYRETWAPSRKQRGLPVVALNDAQEEIRKLLRAERLTAEVGRWTQQLRERANVDVYTSR